MALILCNADYGKNEGRDSFEAEEVDIHQLTTDFYLLYRNFHVRKNEKRQTQKRDKTRVKSKQRCKILADTITTNLPISTPRISILGNCSFFAAYSSARQVVLEHNFAEACRKWLVPLEDTDGETNNTGERLPSPVPLPKTLICGLEVVFQLIEGSQELNPVLCIKSLESLLNILESQNPQSFRKEPASVINTLFSILLTLSKCENSNAPSSSKSKSLKPSQSITSVATACLVSLAIARGDTKSMLESIASLFMCGDQYASQEFKNPEILKSLQRSTQAILVGRSVLPQWLSHGIPTNSLVHSFKIMWLPITPSASGTSKSLACDGKSLFLHCNRGLFKVGSGNYGTVESQHCQANEDFFTTENVWLGWASGNLYCRILSFDETKLHIVDQSSLQLVKSVEISQEKYFTMFSDGVNIGMILSTKEDGFLVRTMAPSHGVMEVLNEFNLRLVRKSVEVAGPCPWDGESVLRPVLTGVDEDVSSITSGKDFALLRTQHGRILYCGKGASLGQKAGISKYSKWLELGLSKCPRFVQCAVGHEGIHALLLAEDGTSYFVGTPKRGEDGDQAKLRRVAKASKPKKVIRMEGHDVAYIACNNGTSAFVTRTGDVYLYGKDTAHCDPTTGHLSALRDVFITQIAMGKAHSVLLSVEGKVFTMGINNRGQCGRSFLPPKDDGHDPIDDDDGEWDETGAVGGVAPVAEPEQEGMCPSGTHRWKHEQCMVCTVCRECTGYGSACISALRPDRNPGQECGCGVGDAGCAECGSCRTCAREGIEEQDYLPLNPEELPEFIHIEDPRVLVPEAMQSERKSIKASSSTNSTKRKETSMTSFPPSLLKLPTTNPIIQVACGLHHSVFLDSKGSVFVCGSNTCGQLGLNDLSPRHTPTRVKFPEADCKIVQIAAGSYHTAALDASGVVYTCGAHTKGQLARAGDEEEGLWFAKMVAIDNTGVKAGRRVTWIGATGDCTYTRVEASLISPSMLQKSTVTANAGTIIIIPPPWTQKFATSIMINRRDGCCSYFEGDSQVSLNTAAVCLDPVYDFLWSVEGNHVKCFNIIASGFRRCGLESSLCLSKPPFTVPVAPTANIQRWQAGASMLACMSTLVAAHLEKHVVHPEEQAAVPAMAKAYSRDDYSAVCRFESHGGGWGYSGHSIEAIRFSCDADIILGGFGLFGGRGENTAKIKLFDIGAEGGEVEGDGELLAESEEIPYECASRQKYRMMFSDPVPLQAGRWYVAWTHISGASSDCGSNGQSAVLAEDQVMFHFKSSKKSNNGTDVNAGQIPQILYRLNAIDPSNIGYKPKQQLEPVHLLSNDFVNNFTPESIQILISLIGWCWNQLQNVELESSTGMEVRARADLMKFIACSCLRLIEFCIKQVYKHKGCVRLGQSENLTMAEAIGDVRSMLHTMISTPLKKSSHITKSCSLEILNQCCDTFVSCFQVFYPTCALKWECLANFLYLYLKKEPKYARMLSCVVGALCTCRGQLLGIFPVLNCIVKQSPDETSLTFVTNTEGGKLKQPANNRLLVGQMTARNALDNFMKPPWKFWDVLEHILTIIDADDSCNTSAAKNLVCSSSILLAKLMEELVSHASGTYAELECAIGQIIASTPSRFTRTNQSRTWNTGNGSPDAVSFTVDQPGVSLFGACIYSGTGTYEYELELFQEVDVIPDDSCDQGGPKWVSLESVRGSFDSEECWGDIAEIKFNKPVLIRPGVKYALRLKNHGSRTCNGDGGVSILRCPDGTTFNFSSCAAHSLNGTNQIRGQIPHLLYFRNPDDTDARQKAKALAETQARKCAHRIASAIFTHAKEVLQNLNAAEDISNSTLVTILLPSILAHLPQLGVSDPRSCVELLELIRSIMPLVSQLNNVLFDIDRAEKRYISTSTGIHYAWVESDHPYKMATIMHYKVTFPATVQRMTVEFDPRCHTAQSEDSLQMYIPCGKDKSSVETDREVDPLSSYIPIMERYHGDNWPLKTVILPGNEVLFSLETASDFVRIDRREYFGFRCLVSGYEWKNCSGLARLEMELAYLGGYCAHQLIKKDLVLPPVSAEEVDTCGDGNSVEEKIVQTCTKHYALFAKGLSLEYFPNVQEALDGIVPLREKSKEREFVLDFINRVPGSSGERLSNWLQPESFVDPHKCEIVSSKEAIRRGRPTVFVLVTRDQYGEAVVAQGLSVELKAIPHATNEHRPKPSCSSTVPYKPMQRRDLDNLDTPFQVTVKEKMKYHAISMMKEYESYSFEELRLMSPSLQRSSESMLIRQNNNATYTATWTPASTGVYHISLSIDGCTIPQITKVEVEEAPDGSFLLNSKKHDESSDFNDPALGKMRKFEATDSAGLRIRSHPSLQSEQIGKLPVNGVIRFTMEVHNDDGIWVKLNDPSLQAFCDGFAHGKNVRTEGWCLQYNQHVAKRLLFPVGGPKQLPDSGLASATVRKMTNESSVTNADKCSKALRLNAGPGVYHVVSCGVSGHNIRTQPSLSSSTVGILAMGTTFCSVEECVNHEGIWVRLDPASQQKHCYNSEGDAWSLAVGRGDVVHLQSSELKHNRKGYDFSVALQHSQNMFDNNVSPPAAFGPADSSQELHGSQSKQSDNEPQYLFPSTIDEIVHIRKDPVESLHQSGSPSKTITSTSSLSAKAESSRDKLAKSIKASKASSFSALQKWLQLGSSDSKSSGSENSISGYSSLFGASEMTKSLVKERVSALSSDKLKSVSSATQTSPDSVPPAFSMPIQFNVGSNGTLTHIIGSPSNRSSAKASPKVERKHKSRSSGQRTGRRDREKDRSKSPSRLSEIAALGAAPVKSAVGPGLAQSIRAIFGAVMWNAGIVHDAMACASYLKFQKRDNTPTPSNQGKLVNGPIDQIPLHEDDLLISIIHHSNSTAADPKAQEENHVMPKATEQVEVVKSVVMRKKTDSPSKYRQQKFRHSVEVTSAAWYLKENPEIQLEEFGFSTVKKSIADDVVSSNVAIDKDSSVVLPEIMNNEDNYPPAMVGLEKIWNHVKVTCTDILLKDTTSSSSAPLDTFKATPVRMRKDRKSSRCPGTESKHKSRRERPKQLHSHGKGLPLEPDDNRELMEEMQQCEICQVRFPRRGRSRNLYFGFHILCENCSERHLKIKKQQVAGTIRSLKACNSVDSTSTNFHSPTDVSQPFARIMSNSYFLVLMTNTSNTHPDPPCHLSPMKATFSCYSALGLSESQIVNDDSPFRDENSPDGVGSERDVSSGLNGFAIDDAMLRFKEEVKPRRRKVSNGDQLAGEDLGFTLLNHPSGVLQKVLNSLRTDSEQEAMNRVCAGAINFISEKHDLDSLKLYLFQAIRRVTCRSYGMQTLSWLIRNVSQPIALHDLMWWYSSSLEVKSDEEVTENENLDNGWWKMRAHPLIESPASIFPMLTDSFYVLLQTIADVMPYLPIGSPLLEMAVKCWGVCFSRKDHKFLHRSKIFRNISQIMSQFDHENEWYKTNETDLPYSFSEAQQNVVTCYTDLTSTVEVKVSSRAALCSSLTDSSTETFWESGEEDRSRTKSITIISSGEFAVKVLAVHVDNIRDSQYKVSSVTVKIGPHLEELSSIGHVEIDIRHCGWCWFPVECSKSKIYKLEIKGPDNTLRVRQIRVLGVAANSVEGERLEPNTVIAQRKCENETLRIFRLLSSEVFGKLLNHIKRGEDDAEGNDLQEHVVGILFSRNKLTHLQKQVCSHIVGAIHREALKIKEEFDLHTSSSILEANNEHVRIILGDKPKVGDRYCFEMLSLVLALAGSQLGRSYLSQQNNLIQDLMQLLHVGTPRIQRQVTAVLRKILPEIKPDDFARIVCHAQDSSYHESKDLGILDMLLGCIIKSLQVKVRTAKDGNRSARNINTIEIYTQEDLPVTYWFLRGESNNQLANTVVKLVKDMCEPEFSEEWASVTKSAVAEAVLHLTRIDATGRGSEECLVSPKFWIALAALCVLHPEHSKLLSSPIFQNGAAGRAKCVNHDDGETLAVIQCTECQDLCAECDRFLHLPKKSWNHIRKVCKEEEESIRVDLHEGCGRIKLFWLMALADSSTLKALVEFRNEIPQSFTDSVSTLANVGKCRFCNKVGNNGPLALGNVCAETECQEYAKTACERILDCGHLCGGVKNEMKCLPCLQQGCSDKLGTILKQDSEDMCMICFTDALASAPAIQLECGHVYHYHCCRSVLERKWAGPRITFSFSFCPICKADICHPLLEDILKPIRELFLDVQRKSLMRLEYEGLNNVDAITLSGGRYYNNPAGFAMDRYAYYVCYKCKKAYFGGEARCDVEIQLEFDPSELVCGGCSDVSQAQLCPRHGTDFLEYKCRYCCSVAVFFCFGTTHFCNGCHDDFQRITAMPKNQLPSCPAGPRAIQLEGEECPLHVFHPPTGEEFALGCGICRNAHTF